VGVLTFAAASAATAQSRDSFTPGYTDVGPVIGLGGLGDASASVGVRFEYGIEQLPSLANGVLSFAASLDHYSYDAFGHGFTYTPIGATINYHFRLDNQQFDPFLGLGLGDYLESAPANCPECSFNHGVYLIGRLGLRYFWKPGVAFYGDVGSGAGALHLGVMFKLRGGK